MNPKAVIDQIVVRGHKIDAEKLRKAGEELLASQPQQWGEGNRSPWRDELVKIMATGYFTIDQIDAFIATQLQAQRTSIAAKVEELIEEEQKAKPAGKSEEMYEFGFVTALKAALSAIREEV